MSSSCPSTNTSPHIRHPPERKGSHTKRLKGKKKEKQKEITYVEYRPLDPEFVSAFNWGVTAPLPIFCHTAAQARGEHSSNCQCSNSPMYGLQNLPMSLCSFTEFEMMKNQELLLLFLAARCQIVRKSKSYLFQCLLFLEMIRKLINRWTIKPWSAKKNFNSPIYKVRNRVNYLIIECRK